jgi:hypothetical protein
MSTPVSAPANATLSLADVVHAPELASLELLAHALRVASLALVAQYPHLLGDANGRVCHHADPVAQLADRLLGRARQLDILLRRYRTAIAAVRDLPDDDLPF